MIRLEPIIDVAYSWAHEQGAWPWTVIGVFPSADSVAEEPEAEHRAFAYTVGLAAFEVWCPQQSVEGRGMGMDLLNMVVNGLAFATRDSVLNPGDTAAYGLGIAGPDGEWERDADAVFWIGEIEPAGRRETWQSPAPDTLPVLWSSPLGWP